MCKVFSFSSKSMGSRLGNCDLRPCMQGIQKNENKINKNKEEGEIMILILSPYYNLTMKTYLSVIYIKNEIK